MLFSSLVFIMIFLPVVLISYFVIPNRIYRNCILLIFSLIFYSWGEPVYIFLMIFAILINYFLAILMEKAAKPNIKRLWLILMILIDVGMLFYFKYIDFFITMINDLLSTNIALIEIALPIGISFYTFQILSYVIDVYRGKVKVQNNVLDLATYITMFPQLVAGPIVRYETIERELGQRQESIDDFAYGLRRFIVGLGKKIIIANNVALIADTIFLNMPLNEYTSTVAWVGAIAFTLQIYFDFSGYSDMAIGLGRIFGFHFLENFNYPYIARSVTDFWRRWHISLSTWFRDYIYIPLGGNRVSKLKWIRNVMVVWMLTGFWHGASYNFIVWGLYFGILLIVEKLIFKNKIEKIWGINHIYALIIIIFGFVIFNSTSVEQISTFAENMFLSIPDLDFMFIDNYGIAYLLPYMILGIIGATPIFKMLSNSMDKYLVYGIFKDLCLLGIFVVCIMFLVNDSYNPFIYFRF